MNRDEKTQQIDDLSTAIGQATNAFLIDFKGITVPQVTELRKQVRETQSSYVVVKNTLALIAIKDSPMVALKEHFVGPTAVAFNSTDAVALAKALTKFAKDVPSVNFKGAMLAGQIIPASQIQAIAALPSRDELLAKLLYLMQHPIRGLATVLQANIRKIVIALNEIHKQRSADAPVPEAEAPAVQAEAQADAPATETDAPATETAAGSEPTPEAAG